MVSQDSRDISIKHFVIVQIYTRYKYYSQRTNWKSRGCTCNRVNFNSIIKDQRLAFILILMIPIVATLMLSVETNNKSYKDLLI